MFGTCVSHKTLHGGTATKHPARYPPVSMLEELMWGNPAVMNLLHFNTKEPEELLADLNELQRLAGSHCNGFQINMTWPNIVALEKYKTTHDKEHNIIVLQCGRRALEAVNNDPKVLAAQVSTYSHVIDYVLIDVSGGEGQDFDIEKTIDYFAALEPFENLGFGIAGGLHAETLSRLEPLCERFSSFSIDAESKLRHADDDSLDIAETTKYAQNAVELFMRRHQLHEQR
jgi:hypothetical protein